MHQFPDIGSRSPHDIQRFHIPATDLCQGLLLKLEQIFIGVRNIPVIIKNKDIIRREIDNRGQRNPL